MQRQKNSINVIHTVAWATSFPVQSESGIRPLRLSRPIRSGSGARPTRSEGWAPCSNTFSRKNPLFRPFRS